MTTQPESAIVNAILDALNAMPNTYARKTHGNGYSSGWPDIVGAHQGRMLALEVKQPGKQATPRQLHELRKWGLAGAHRAVVHDVDEAMAAIGYPMLTAAVEVDPLAEDDFVRPRISETHRAVEDDLPPIPECGKCGREWECDCKQEGAVEVRLTTDTTKLEAEMAALKAGWNWPHGSDG